MTGQEVRTLREDLGWTGAQFASLFGVHPSTIYRWEERDVEDLKTEPLQLQLLTVLRSEMRRGKRVAAQLREKLESALAVGGSLRALHVLLSQVYATGDGTGAAVAAADEKQ